MSNRAARHRLLVFLELDVDVQRDVIADAHRSELADPEVRSLEGRVAREAERILAREHVAAATVEGRVECDRLRHAMERQVAFKRKRVLVGRRAAGRCDLASGLEGRLRELSRVEPVGTA